MVLFCGVLLGGTLVLSSQFASKPQAVDDQRSLVGIQGGFEGWQKLGLPGGGPSWHKNGSVVMLSGNKVRWREESADNYLDVSLLPNGNVLAAFLSDGYREGCEPYDPPCSKTGYRIIKAERGPAYGILNQTYETSVVEEFSFPVRTRKGSEVHDVEPLSNGEILLADMEHERLLAVKDGEITWEWRAANFYTPPEDPTRHDWLHINDVDVVSEDRYLVSVRNANQLLILERGEGVVEVINSDPDSSDDDNCEDLFEPEDRSGGVRCGDPDLLNHQHNPHYINEDVVLVADSHNDRVVELYRTDADRWEPRWIETGVKGKGYNWPRDADRLENGNTLITDSLNRRLVEVNRAGVAVQTYRFDYIPYEADRLPHGERVDADPMIGPLVFLSQAMIVLTMYFPWLPYWFGEVQLLLMIVSLVGMAAGIVMILVSRGWIPRPG